MNVLDAIKSRREITNFLDKEIDTNVLEKIVDAAFYAPSGNNLPSKEVIIVRNNEKLQSLAQTTPFMNWMENAKAAIVITGRPDVSKYWLQDASIAAGFTWLEVVEQGLGAAFGAVYHAEDQDESKKREDHARAVCNIPSDRRVVAILGIGYPKETPKPKKHLPKEDIVHYETF